MHIVVAPARGQVTARAARGLQVRAPARLQAQGSARRHLDVGDDGEMEVEVEEPASDGNVVSGASGCAPACAHQRTDRTLLGSLGAGAFFPKGMLRSSGAPRPAVSLGAAGRACAQGQSDSESCPTLGHTNST